MTMSTLAPRRCKAHATCGAVLLELGRFAAAVGYYERALSLDVTLSMRSELVGGLARAVAGSRVGVGAVGWVSPKTSRN